jgi:hypothetical protein
MPTDQRPGSSRGGRSATSAVSRPSPSRPQDICFGPPGGPHANGSLRAWDARSSESPGAKAPGLPLSDDSTGRARLASCLPVPPVETCNFHHTRTLEQIGLPMSTMIAESACRDLDQKSGVLFPKTIPAGPDAHGLPLISKQVRGGSLRHLRPAAPSSLPPIGPTDQSLSCQGDGALGAIAGTAARRRSATEFHGFQNKSPAGGINGGFSRSSFR